MGMAMDLVLVTL